MKTYFRDNYLLMINGIVFILLLFGCSRNWDNPFDSNNKGNKVPSISSLTADPDTAGTNYISKLICTASDPDGDTLEFVWTSKSGSINGSGTSVNWISPNIGGTYYITCRVLDGNGGEAIDSVRITVEQNKSEWKDPGFELTQNFSSGPWEVGEARIYDPNYSTSSEWNISIQRSGGNPGQYVYIDDNPDIKTGIALVGQHIFIPEKIQLTNIDISIDAQRFCSISTDRAGGIGFVLIAPDEWDKLDKSVPENDMLYWKDTKKKWEKLVVDISGADWTSWTNVVLAKEDASSLLNVLNNNKGMDVVFAVYFRGVHFNSEYAKFDNFNVNIK